MYQDYFLRSIYYEITTLGKIQRKVGRNKRKEGKGRKVGRKEGRKEGRKGGREEGREGGRKEGRKGGRE